MERTAHWFIRADQLRTGRDVIVDIRPVFHAKKNLGAADAFAPPF